MIILFTSAKGGVGKSTLSVNVAWELARTKKVLLFDADIGSSVDHLFFDMYHGKTIRDYIENGVPFSDIKLKVTPTLHLVSSPNGFWEPNESALKRIRDTIVAQSHVYDYVVIDTHPGTMNSTLEMIKISDSVGIIVNMEDQSIIDNYAMIKQLLLFNINANLFLVTNKIQDPKFPTMILNHMNSMLSKYLGLGMTNREISLGGNISMSSNISWSVRDKKLFMRYHSHTPIATQIRDMIKTMTMPKGA